MHPADLPGFEATWWPISMETVPGSGEAINVAVVVRAASGQASVRQMIDPPTLNAMFGPINGKGMQWMIGSMVLHAQAELDAGVPVEKLGFGLGGFQLLRPRDCTARDLSEVADIATSLSSGFVTSNFGRKEEAPDESKKAFHDWASKIREALFAIADTDVQDAEFDVRLKLPTKTVTYGFVRQGYVANFAVLRPGHTPADLRSIKVKVFDLETLRHENKLLVDQVDLLVGCKSRDELVKLSRREMDTYNDTMAFIGNEAKVRNVRLWRCNTSDEAANVLASELKKRA